ncbi:hypothetical protein QS257_15055 [Terrilactibacillus sp. S3-3]|nr:hypothetical protein QS257_15055 [Terrilactibacillus sp. S3-3]
MADENMAFAAADSHFLSLFLLLLIWSDAFNVADFIGCAFLSLNIGFNSPDDRTQKKQNITKPASAPDAGFVHSSALGIESGIISLSYTKLVNAPILYSKRRPSVSSSTDSNTFIAS